MLYITIHL